MKPATGARLLPLIPGRVFVANETAPVRVDGLGDEADVTPLTVAASLALRAAAPSKGTAPPLPA